MRADGRTETEHRPLQIHRRYTRQAPGSVLIEMGGTRVLCTASLDKKVPDWLLGKGKGWLTAEYAMLPGSTNPRKPREKGKPDGRSVEIARLIGRSLRAVVNLEAFPDRSLWIDCDVLDADGGTRTASITGAYVAAMDALAQSDLADKRSEIFTDSVAAVSLGIIDGAICLDLDYSEDVRAEVDMNVVMTGSGRLIEIQGTAEKTPFTFEQMNAMLALAHQGIQSLTRSQQATLKS